MDEGARRWLLKTARKNYWRVSRWFDLEDLIHEGYAAYYEARSRYPNAIDPPHQMELFKRIFTTRIHDMSKKRTMSAEVLAGDMVANREDRTETILDSVAAEPGLEHIQVELAHAPQYVRDAVALFCNGDRRLMSAYRKMPAGRFLRRESLNDRLCRLIGRAPGEIDIVGAIRRVLGAEAEKPPLVAFHPIQHLVVVERKSRGRQQISTAQIGGQVAVCADGNQSEAELCSMARAVRRNPIHTPKPARRKPTAERRFPLLRMPSRKVPVPA